MINRIDNTLFPRPDQWLENLKQGILPENSLLVKEIEPLLGKAFPLPDFLYHGRSHNQRVVLFSEILAYEYGADAFFTCIAAYCHDLGRINDGTDPDHGQRSWQICKHYLQDILPPPQFNLAQIAIENHSDGTVSSDPLIASIWDADRIDLIRFGRPPVLEKLDPHRFSNPTALKLAALLIQSFKEIYVRD